MGAAADPTSELDQWLTINQACTLVNRSRRTIYHWITKGLLVTRREAGGAQQILASSLYRDEANQPIDAETVADAVAATPLDDELDTE